MFFLVLNSVNKETAGHLLLTAQHVLYIRVYTYTLRIPYTEFYKKGRFKIGMIIRILTCWSTYPAKSVQYRKYIIFS